MPRSTTPAASYAGLHAQQLQELETTSHDDAEAATITARALTDKLKEELKALEETFRMAKSHATLAALVPNTAAKYITDKKNLEDKDELAELKAKNPIAAQIAEITEMIQILGLETDRLKNPNTKSTAISDINKQQAKFQSMQYSKEMRATTVNTRPACRLNGTINIDTLSAATKALEETDPNSSRANALREVYTQTETINNTLMQLHATERLLISSKGNGELTDAVKKEQIQLVGQLQGQMIKLAETSQNRRGTLLAVNQEHPNMIEYWQKMRAIEKNFFDAVSRPKHKSNISHILESTGPSDAMRRIKGATIAPELDGKPEAISLKKLQNTYKLTSVKWDAENDQMVDDIDYFKDEKGELISPTLEEMEETASELANKGVYITHGSDGSVTLNCGSAERKKEAARLLVAKANKRLYGDDKSSVVEKKPASASGAPQDETATATEEDSATLRNPTR